MKTLNQFLITESAEEEKLKHLEHAEDHVINAGHAGFTHAFNTLHGVHQALQGKKSDVTISTKYDGSPSIVFGHHPETGKFFVASKSAFNKNPKLNYNEEDVDLNHGHAPGLASKLKAALKHLKKVAPEKGVFQGDVMHTPEDIHKEGGKIHFKPNTITYSAKAGSEQGKKALESKVGVAVHTAYEGDYFDSMKAKYNPDLSHFGNHKDVHLIHTTLHNLKPNYSKESQKQYQKHMTAAMNASSAVGDHNHLDGHVIPLKTYINKTVRDNTKPTVDGYKKHLMDAANKEAQKVKTQAARERKVQAGEAAVKHVEKNKEEFAGTLTAHHELQSAKNILTKTLTSHEGEFEHTINGKPTSPEGFVAVIKNRPTKLVLRHEFSQANFAKNQ